MRHKEIRFIPFHTKKRKDAEEKFKGFKIRSMVSTINQTQGSSGVSLGYKFEMNL